MSARVAIVTGAASGIGRGIAETLAQQGDHVVVADLNEDQGQDVATAIGGRFVMTDLSLQADCQRLVNRHYWK